MVAVVGLFAAMGLTDISVVFGIAVAVAGFVLSAGMIIQRVYTHGRQIRDLAIELAKLREGLDEHEKDRSIHPDAERVGRLEAGGRRERTD